MTRRKQAQPAQVVSSVATRSQKRGRPPTPAGDAEPAPKRTRNSSGQTAKLTKATTAKPTKTTTAKPTKATTSTQKAKRKPPAPVAESSDEEVPDSEEIHRRAVTQPHQKGKEKSTDSQEDEGPSGSGGEENLDAADDVEEEDDLSGLGPDHLASMLNSELAKFGDTNTDRRSSPQSQQAEQGSSATITISDDDDEEPEQETSVRCTKLLSEIPQWASSSGDNEFRAISPFNSQLTVVKYNHGWEEEAHYTPAKPGQRLIGIGSQPLPLQRVIRAGIQVVIENAIRDGFFTANNPAAVLSDIAKGFGYRALSARFKGDKTLGRETARVINHRLALRRSTIKPITNNLVGVHYGFEICDSIEDCKKRVETLTKGMAYIFPENNGRLVTTKPYQHPCIISTLKKFVFEGSSKLFQAEHTQTIFASSLEEYPNELEIPVAVLALAATAIHASINDWMTGVHKPSDFASDTIEDIYAGHMKFLDSFQNNSEHASKYHVMMNTLFKKCRPSESATSTAIAKSIQNMINLDELDDITNN